MKKQTLLLLLSSLMLGSCQNVFVSDSSDVYIPTDDVSQEDSSSEEVKDSSSSVQVDSSSTEDIVDKDINVNEVLDCFVIDMEMNNSNTLIYGVIK